MLSIVIPAYNEEGAITETVRTAAAVCAEAGIEPFEVVVVDDGSTDSTARRAEEAGARVLRHPHNMGYGFSLKSGIRAAEYDAVVISDADGTYPVEEIPRLFEEFGKGFDMVVGARTGEHYRESMFKMPLRFILRMLSEFAVGGKIPDINSGLRIFSKKGAAPYFNHLCNTFSFTTSITLAYMLTGKFVQYLPIPYRPRVGQSKVRLFRDSLRTLQFIVQTILFYNPIKLFLVVCLLTLGMGALSLLVFFFLGPVGALYLGVACLLTALIIFSLGLLTEMLRQTSLSRSGE